MTDDLRQRMVSHAAGRRRRTRLAAWR